MRAKSIFILELSNAVFFFPDIAKLINWRIPPIFLDKEFQQLSPNAEVGKRYADQLVQVELKRGKSLILLLHLEIQATKEQKFEKRMLTYALRIYDFLDQPACSLAILCDANAQWRPKEHTLVTPGSRLTFEFTAIKLLDYREQWAALETNDNPFATVVMAHLKAQETQNKASERKNWKFQLVRELYEKGYNRSQVLDLFRFIDWIIVLPAGLSNSFWNDLKSYEEEKKMTYITSIEKIGFKRGQQEGRKQGRKEGQKEGLQEGLKEGEQKTQQKIVLKMLEKGMSVEEIATITDLSMAEVEHLAQSQKA